MNYGNVISQRILSICEQKHITLNKLATVSGISHSTLVNISKGNTKNPTLKTLHRISVGLEIPVSELLDFLDMNETIFDNE